MYIHKDIEAKWQNYWDKNKTFKVENDFSKPKYYTLDMFPYPSGAWLHVGHPEWYTANDIVARYKTANWFNVLHPMGWDAFWLPAENYAIKTGTHPRVTTDNNIDTFKKQIKALGFSYDWDREIDTTDPKYYKWTQWIFLKLFENGLAYEQDLPINYCPSCKTWLANEEVLYDFTCERCGTKVEKKKLRQWVLAITKYADRLLNDVDKLDWPEGIKDMQRNWIWKSEGCEFEMKLSMNPLKKQLQKNEACISDGVGLNCPAKASHISIILNNTIKVKKKTHFIKKIDATIINWDKKIIFNSANILKHFRSKSTKEFNYRKNILWTIFYNIDKIKFNSENIWNIIFKNNVIKVVLWKQNNWNYYVKTFYQNDKLTNSLKEYNNSPSIKVYTTRIDTVFGMTYAVLAPDHPQVNDFITKEQKVNCEKYISNANSKSDQDRTADDKEKTWVFTGSYLINPFNWKEVALWIWDYILGNYGSWAVMAVPAHDTRDFEFAKKYDLEIIESISGGDITESAFTEYWILTNSGEFDWLKSAEAKVKLTEYAEKNWFWEKKVNYKLRDWLFSRQRYWWEPIPLIHLDIGQLKKLKHINIETTKKENSSPQSEVGPLLDSAKFSYKFSILKTVQKVKWKDKKTQLFKLNKEIITKKWTIIFDWRKLANHFRNKTDKEFTFRSIFWKKILNNLDKLVFENDLIWYININKKIFRVVLEKIDDKKYEVKTYYSSENYTKIFNTAYILKRPPKDWESSCDSTTCSGKVRELIIDWKVFSKIYDGIYGKIVCDYNLPLELPEVENYEPAWDWHSPLAKVEDFVHIKLADNLVWKRETNTMPQWWGSCWYYLWYMDPENDKELVNPDVEKYWGQVDSYVWWAEHAVLHLLYSRFWHKFLFDIWVVSNDEPFYRLKNQGLILAHAFQRKNWWLVANDLVEEKDWKYFEISSWEELNRIVSKMSKSLKNVVNPDDIIEEYWSDSLRLYEMYMAEFKDSAPWDTKGIVGVRRFLEKSERLFTAEAKQSSEEDNNTMKLLHKTIKKVEEDIENYKFNTAIAAMIILVNNWLPKDETMQSEWKSKFTRILHPFAPHLAEELWERIWETESVFKSSWPEYDKNLVVDDTIKIAVQVLGKVRWTIEINKDEDKDSVLEKAKTNSDVAKWLEAKDLVKEIYVPGKIVNLVVK